MTVDDSKSWLTNLLAEEGEWGRLSMWQLGSWAIAAISALVVAFFAIHSPMRLQRDDAADADLMQQTQQIQRIAKESQSETRRLASAIDTLNLDRDRLYARVTILEQGLHSVTGSVERQSRSASLGASSTAQALAPASTISAPLISSPTNESASSQVDLALSPELVERKVAPPLAKESSPRSALSAPLEASAMPKLVEIQPIPPAVHTSPDKVAGSSTIIAALSKEVAVQRTEFGVDLGGANSVDGLRALWNNVLKSNTSLLSSLHPIIVIKERRGGSGMQLRLVAGPLNDTAEAAKVCAGLAESKRTCEPAVFDGQHLALKVTTEESTRPPFKRRASRSEETPPPQPAPQSTSPLY